MNHLTASGLLRSQFSGIRQMMNGMAELLQNLYISAANSYFLFEKEMVLLKQKRFGMEEMMERYRDRGISVEERVKDLLSRMTTEEKIRQTDQFYVRDFARTDPEGFWGIRRLRRAGTDLRRAGVLRVLVPRGFQGWGLWEGLGLRRIETEHFLRAQALPLALGALGFASMWLAIFADVGVMVLAVLNAIRALFVQNL